VALAALALALLAPQAFAARFAYTGNYDDGTVSVIDTATNQVVGAPIPVGEGASSIAFTPDGKTAYVANRGSEDVTPIDTATRVAGAPIPIGVRGATIAMAPSGGFAYVTSADEPKVVVISIQTNQVIGPPIEVGLGPWGVAFTPDGKFAYVTNEGDDTVSVIDTQTGQAAGPPIAVGLDPVNVVFTPDGKTAWVANEGGASVSVIDTATRQVVVAIPVGEYPWGLAMSPDGTRLYVSAIESDNVTVIDTATRQVVGSPIPTGDEPYEIGLTPDGKTLYTADYGSEAITVINTQALQPVTSIPVAGGPWQVTVAPDLSPAASFTVGKKLLTKPVPFNGSASSDPDGLVVRFDWNFGDGKKAVNGSPTPKHKYKKAGKFKASLTVTDNEGCSANLVFTGRSAYCSGSALAAQTQTFKVKPPNSFKFGKLTRNAKNGTAKLKVKVPAAGKLVLSGKGVKKATGRAKKAKTVTLAVRPQGQLASLLESAGEAKVRIRVTYSPTGGKSRSQGKTLKLIES